MPGQSKLSSPLVDIIDSLGIAVWELDLELRVLSYNRKAKEIYGEDVIGKYCYDAAVGHNRICSNCPAVEVLEGSPLGRSIHSRIQTDGQPITIDHIASPRYDHEGKLIGIVIAIYDITKHIETQKELEKHKQELEELVSKRTLSLQRSEEKYRKLYEETKLQSSLYHSILNSTSDAIVIYDLESRVKYLNSAFTQIFGWSLDELLGQRIPFMPDSEREESLTRILDVIKHGSPCNAFETRRYTKDGRLLEISLSSSRYTDHHGETGGIVVILRDITELKKAQQEAIKAHKLESIGVLAGGIAHDFNNILSAIMGNITLAQMCSDQPDKVKSLLEASEKACLRAQGLTQQLLTFSKGGEPIRKATDIEGVILDSAKFVLRGSNVKCEFSITPNLKPAMIDADQISQVIQNIIINAKQAMPEGGIIRVTAEPDRLPLTSKYPEDPLSKNEYIKICILDQGPGISSKIVGQIFDPYFTTRNTGSGLGLAITHSIIKKHGGQIKVRSTPGQGCEFIIYLPVAEDRLQKTEHPSEAPVNTTMPSRILVVDDEDMIRDLLFNILQTENFSVTTAASGEEGIELYRQAQEEGQSYGLVIMDLTLPGGINGVEASQKIKKLDPNAKIVVSSGYADDPILSDYQNYGFIASLEKPFKVKDVLEITCHCLNPDSS